MPIPVTAAIFTRAPTLFLNQLLQAPVTEDEADPSMIAADIKQQAAAYVRCLQLLLQVSRTGGGSGCVVQLGLVGEFS